ncbi:hypothetical protein [Funiculus sociatus]
MTDLNRNRKNFSQRIKRSHNAKIVVEELDFFCFYLAFKAIALSAEI